jgi:uncharacterized protein YjbI with pentapeptide repeats
MKVIKSQRVSVLTRPYEVRRELRLGVSVLLFVPLGKARALLSEIALWKVAAEEMGGVPVLDAGIPKSRCEYLVAGAAYPVLGRENRECAVRATVGGHQKTLLVAGDRYWENGSISEAQPFDKIPLDWRHAFGGPNFAPNPVGRGLVPEDESGVPVLRLPNIEYSNEQVQDRAARPRPAGFGALDVTVPVRAQKAGTYDARWLKEDFPGFAQDIDWTFFNVAPPDQQFDQDAFALDTEYELRNLHPSRGVIEGRLPNFRARCFVSRAGKPPEALEEVSLRLGTLWFFPAVERAVLVFHGAAEVAEDDASDITHLVAAAEDAGSDGRPASYYAEVLGRRLDRENGHIAALKDGDLCPSELAPVDSAAAEFDAEAEGEDLLEQRQAKRRDREIAERRAEIVAYGLDPDDHGPRLASEEPVPTLDEMPAFLEKIQAEVERHEREQKEDAERRERDNVALFEQLGLDYGVVRTELAHPVSGPPELTAEARADDLRQMIASYEAQGLPTAHIQEILDDPEQQRMWRFAEEKGRQAYRLSAHFQHPAPAASAEASERARAALGQLRSLGAGGMDFTGADLSGLDLAGINLEGAFLESVCFAGTNLRGAKLSGAVLAHADLRGADLEGAALRGANLGAAQLGGANLGNAELEDAILKDARLERVRFDGAHLASTDLSGAKFEATSFARVNASETTFMDCEMRGTDFTGAQLERCNFMNVDLSEARFCDANLSASVMFGCKVVAADFMRARLVGLRAVEGTVFDRASFFGADLGTANLRELSLQGVRLEHAKLDRADLSSANLEGANLYRSIARGALFGRANLTRVRFVAANLMGARLASARLDGADLTGAHLYAADLSRIHLDSATRFEPASLVHARIYPVRQGSRVLLPDLGAR